MRSTMLILFITTCIISGCCSTGKTPGMPQASKLAGLWELNFISGQSIALDSLYPNKKPTINFDETNKRVYGNSSCNNFNGALKVEGHQISFPEPMVMTRMACMDGNGEMVFMEALNKITSFAIDEDGKTLHLNSGKVEMMRLTKK
jgi:heat shock protein HslJ